MLSIVVPVCNEEESLKPFYTVLYRELTTLKAKYEILFIDDGSRDASLKVLKGLAKKNRNIRIFSFQRNQGKAEALSYGFQKVKGDLVITLDADLEDRPEEMKNLLKKGKEGWDVVIGWRKNRKHSLVMRLPSKLFNFMNRVFWGLKLHDYNSGLKLLTVNAAKSLHLYGGMHRFIPLISHDQGFSVTEIPVKHKKRQYGESKYGFSKVFTNIPDMFTMLFLVKYRKRPLHFFGPVGGGLAIIGFLLLLYLTYVKLVLGQAIGGRPLLLFAVLFVVSGLQIFFTGFIAELLVSTSSRDASSIPLKYES